MTGIPADLTDEFWGDPPWPAKFKRLQDHQVDAVTEIVGNVNEGVTIQLVSAPTGSGKTALAEAVRRTLQPPRTLYVANTKGLQDQFMRDFGGYAKCLKGRANYPTYDHPELFRGKFAQLSAGDCTRKMEVLPACGSCTEDSPLDSASNLPKPLWHCDFCHPVAKCPYRMAKSDALDSALAVTNTAYFLSEANSVGEFTHMDLVIVDEADTLESILMGMIEVYISARDCSRYDISPPERKTVESTWLPWVEEEAIPKVVYAVTELRNRKEVEARREKARLERLLGRLEGLKGELKLGNAVYDGYKDNEIRFRPVRVSRNALELLWPHSSMWMLMSATLEPMVEFVDSLGIEQTGAPWASVHVPSTFPPENRPIHIKPIVEMTLAKKDEAWPKMAEGIVGILNHHSRSRTLIHTVSYAFADYLNTKLTEAKLGRPVFVYKNASERERILAEYSQAEASILIAASMDRGVDLPEDLCRVVIVAKCPFPNKGDKQVEKRMYTQGGKMWYAVQTVRSMVQMTGRGVRSESDTCHTYILDKMFMTSVLKSHRTLLPGWWMEAVDYSGGVFVPSDDEVAMGMVEV